jgi:hypothetical protein
MRFKTFNYKFQAIAVGSKTHAKTPVFKIDSAEITCDEVVKLLGIDIDYQLNIIYIRQGVIISIIIQCTIFNKIKDVVNKNIK